MAERTVGWVWGYLPGIDRRSEAATRLGLHHRFSLAFNRYPDSAHRAVLADVISGAPEPVQTPWYRRRLMG